MPSATLPSVLAGLDPVPLDEIFALNRAFATDPASQKVSLGVGVYRTDDGKPWPLPVVEKAEKQLLDEGSLFRHEYSAIEGDVAFVEQARNLMFGFDRKTESPKEKEAKKRIASVQTVAGTGANHLGALFLKTHMKPKNVWLSNPSWANHLTIWEVAGVSYKTYPYYNAATRSLDFDGMMSALENEGQEGDIVLLHACAHNPTGLDPTKEQWKAIAELCERKKLFPFFDSAYQGFATGSVEDDAWAVRYFFENKPSMEMCVAQSFSKNFGLYGQRVGAFHYVLNVESTGLQEAVFSNLCNLIRGEFSMGPVGGSTIVKKVLTDDNLTSEWHDNLKTMSSRIISMRKALYDELTRLGTPGTWEHIVQQNGMFSYTGLTPGQVQSLKEKYHVYMLKSGRISISGLSKKNVTYVAQAIDDTVRNVS
ncbi:Aspartate aminotransferase [Aspergillus sclerotialis]|uniref:Aspartate aminotransferase n=1 Tax=Aspergillus sclerotialis TaxID=2070753 RepID=A0A3A2ZAD8_9EURO|nr:Aspartate aminotransferase [Aspergillus sclerotialis]